MNTHLIVPRARRRSSPLAARRLASPGWLADFDRFFDAFWGEGLPATRDGAPVYAPPLDYRETEKEIEVAAELPGFEEKDIRVTLEQGVLTIEAERSSEHEEADEERGFRHVERARGHFRRSLRLGAEVDEESVAASYRNGVLTVTLPKLDGPEVRTIPVTTS